MSQHTPGPWLATKSKHGIDDGNHVIAVLNPEAGDRAILIHSEGEAGNSFADARRIVACVNACEGSETEILEQLGGDFVKPLIDLIDQRDELLVALKTYEQAFEKMFCQCSANGIKDAWGRPVSCSLLNEAHCAAEKAIAKVEKKQ